MTQSNKRNRCIVTSWRAQEGASNCKISYEFEVTSTLQLSAKKARLGEEQGLITHPPADNASENRGATDNTPTSQSGIAYTIHTSG
jgi:hypothetical protein